MATIFETAINNLVIKQTALLDAISTSAATVRRYVAATNGPGTIVLKPNNDETVTGTTWLFGKAAVKGNLNLEEHLTLNGIIDYIGDGDYPAGSGIPCALYWRSIGNLTIQAPRAHVIAFHLNPKVNGVSASNSKISWWHGFLSTPIFSTNHFLHTFHYYAHFETGGEATAGVGDFEFLRNSGYVYGVPKISNHSTKLDYNTWGGLTGFQCYDLTAVQASKLEARWMFGFISSINMNTDVCWIMKNGQRVNNAWNFYANGNAPNFFGGKVLIGSTSDNKLGLLQVNGYGYFENRVIVGSTSNSEGAHLQLNFSSNFDDVTNDQKKCWNIDVYSHGPNSNQKALRFSTLYQSPNNARGELAAQLELSSSGESILSNSKFSLTGTRYPNQIYGEYGLGIAHSVYINVTPDVDKNPTNTYMSSYFSTLNQPHIYRSTVNPISRIHQIVGVHNLPVLQTGLINDIVTPANAYTTGLDIQYLTGYLGGFLFHNNEANQLLRYQIAKDIRAIYVAPLSYSRNTARVPGSYTGDLDHATLETVSVGGNIYGVVVSNLIPRDYNQESAATGRFKLTLGGKIYGVSTWQETLPGLNAFNFFAGGTAPSFFNGHVKIGNGDIDTSEADNFSTIPGTTIPYNFEVLDYTHLEHLHVDYPLTGGKVVDVAIATYSIVTNVKTITFTTETVHGFRVGDIITVSGMTTNVNPYPLSTINSKYKVIARTNYTITVNYLGLDPALTDRNDGVINRISSLVELGNPYITNTPSLDFHCIGKTVSAATILNNYDVRLEASQITSAGYTSLSNDNLEINGEGRFSIFAKETYLSNYLVFNEIGDYAPPNVVTSGVPRSIGSKIVLWPFPRADRVAADYAIGIEGYHTWFGVPYSYSTNTDPQGFKWYGADKCAMRLGADGTLNVGFLDLSVSPGIVNVAGSYIASTAGTISANTTYGCMTVTSTAGLTPGMVLTKVSGAGVFGTAATIIRIDSATRFIFKSTSANTAGAIGFTAKFTGGTATATINGTITLTASNMAVASTTNFKVGMVLTEVGAGAGGFGSATATILGIVDTTNFVFIADTAAANTIGALNFEAKLVAKLCIHGKQVLTYQRPYWTNAGWGAEPTSTVAIPTDTATLITTVKYLVAALQAHGLLGDATDGTVLSQLTGIRT